VAVQTSIRSLFGFPVAEDPSWSPPILEESAALAFQLVLELEFNFMATCDSSQSAKKTDSRLPSVSGIWCSSLPA